MDCQANRDGSSNDSAFQNLDDSRSPFVCLFSAHINAHFVSIVQVATSLGEFVAIPSTHIAFQGGSRPVTLALLVCPWMCLFRLLPEPICFLPIGATCFANLIVNLTRSVSTICPIDFELEQTTANGSILASMRVDPRIEWTSINLPLVHIKLLENPTQHCVLESRRA